jgi:2-polyprenyl-6-methoxyphenol hydroxylase-like FAD-dependent oxidoreductase
MLPGWGDGMRILVAGAGIAGLTFAALMKQRGRDVELIDGAEDPSAVTYPLVLAPLGSRVLHGFGILRRFRATSPELDILRVADFSGHAIGELDLRALTGPDERCRIVQRTALLRLLAELSDNPPVKAATSIEDIAQDGNKLVVKLSNGETSRYDLVVGADGARSALRKKYLPQVNHFDTGWGCWSFPTNHAEPGRALEYWGRGRMLSLRSGAWEMSGMLCAPARKFKAMEDRRERVQRLFRGANSNAGSAIESFPDNAALLLYRPVEDFRALHWVKNRICLLGDAACAYLPTSPLGAAMAMESAAVLADELSRAGSNTIPQALGFYEARCRPRNEKAQDESRKNAKALFRANPLMAMTYDPSKRFADYRIIEKLLATPV